MKLLAGVETADRYDRGVTEDENTKHLLMKAAL